MHKAQQKAPVLPLVVSTSALYNRPWVPRALPRCAYVRVGALNTCPDVLFVGPTLAPGTGAVKLAETGRADEMAQEARPRD